MKQYDAIIIGFGKAGKTLAAELSNRGWQVAVVEQSDEMYGGACPNVACIPTKTLIHESEISTLLYHNDFDKQSNMYRQAIARKNKLTSFLRENNYEKLSKRPNVTIYTGKGSLVSANTVKVALPEEEIELQGKEIFINTGSTPIIPSIEGIQQSRNVYTSTTLLELDILPKHLIIVGGGYIGLEFSSMYSGFGSEVTVIQNEARLIPREDEDIASEIQKVMEEKGVKFVIGAAISGIRKEGDWSYVHYSVDGKEGDLEADAILVATGRRPNTAGLNLEAAGVELTARGGVKVDDGYKTTAPNIWAMGDVAGGLQFTYVSLDDFRIVWSSLHGGAYDANAGKRSHIPYSVFIEPSFSRVGMNEQEARGAGLDVKIAKLPAAAIPKAAVLNRTKGLLKAVIDAKTNKILGAMLFCEESYEMINIVKLAMDLDADYTVLRDQIYTHPTMSEALGDLFAV